MKMKKILTTILAAAILALPIRVGADAVEKPYCGAFEYADIGHHTTILKADGEKDAFVPQGAVEYTEVKDAENGQRTMLVKRVRDCNGDGIFNGEDYFIDEEYYIKTGKIKGTDSIKGQEMLNELKSYFLPKSVC